jgi:DNA (cytosine-5)-methyltransferase 1
MNYKTLKCVELFAGGGGLALGAKYAGFHNVLSLEWEKNSCNTLRKNAPLLFDDKNENRIFHQDVRSFDPNQIKESFQILLGGPPCQPFSIGGQKKGFDDSRDLFPEYFRILKHSRPKAFMVENVKGITSPRFKTYLDFILLQLAYVDRLPKKKIDWIKSYEILKNLKERGIKPTYKVSFKVLNAVDYGVPQRRERVFIVGFLSDLTPNWKWPEPTHCEDALLFEKFVTGAYFERHGLKRQVPSSQLETRLSRLRKIGCPQLFPYKTVRDALKGLPEAVMGKPNAHFANHIGIAGAKSYPGHTGSPFDDPAKTLKAGVHGCPGGENMLAYPNGTLRYFTVRESARLQTFPDNYTFVGSRSETMRQIGNAVPVKLAEFLLINIRSHLLELLSKAPSIKSNIVRQIEMNLSP